MRFEGGVFLFWAGYPKYYSHVKMIEIVSSIDLMGILRTVFITWVLLKLLELVLADDTAAPSAK